MPARTIPLSSAAVLVAAFAVLSSGCNNSSPGVQEGQTVTMTIEIVDGRLVGRLTPFFGGDDGASFVDVHIVGEELRASAVVGKPPAVEPGGRGAGPLWKIDTKILFALRADRTRMKGTGDVQLDGVKWMQYNYDLEKKRSRY